MWKIEYANPQPAQEALRQMLDEAYERGRRDALRGVQGACWYLHGNLWEGRFRLASSDERRDMAAIEIALQAKAAEEAAR